MLFRSGRHTVKPTISPELSGLSRFLIPSELLRQEQIELPCLLITRPEEAASDFVKTLETPLAWLENGHKVGGDGGENRVYQSQTTCLSHKLSFPSHKLSSQCRGQVGSEFYWVS